MAEFGGNKNAVGPPVAGRKALSGGVGARLETHRGEPVSNGNCSVPDTVKRVQNEACCESPTWESAAPDSGSKTIPRRSSLIKVGHNFPGETKLIPLQCVSRKPFKMHANWSPPKHAFNYYRQDGKGELKSIELQFSSTSCCRCVKWLYGAKENTIKSN